MKSKILIIAIILATATSTASARGRLGLIDYGIKMGVSTQRLNYSGTSVNSVYNLDINNRPAFQFGAMARLNFLVIHLQPEILYTMNRFKLESDFGNSIGSTTVKYNTLEVPVLLGMRFILFRINAGPVFTIMNNTSEKKHSADGPNGVDMSRPTVGWAVGLGLDLFRFNFDIRYNGRFARGQQDLRVGNSEYFTQKTKMAGWSFSVAYVF